MLRRNIRHDIGTHEPEKHHAQGAEAPPRMMSHKQNGVLLTAAWAG
jgi:hypothetical protein